MIQKPCIRTAPYWRVTVAAAHSFGSCKTDQARMMASVGPQLPSTTAEKRKREEDGFANGRSDSSPKLRKKSHSPDLLPKPTRVIGPSLPPASLDERPRAGPESGSDQSSEEDEYGPALPGTSVPSAQTAEKGGHQFRRPVGSEIPVKAQRDDWMIVPPSNNDWSSKVDPTKLRNRKFNTGKSAKLAASGSTPEQDNRWNETPEEKQARLKREMLGIKDRSKPNGITQDSVQDAAVSKKVQEFTERSRGSTLYKEHQKSNPSEREDDPSARAFDREKDVAGGMKINTTQRKELMKKAADFGSRFSSAKYL